MAERIEWQDDGTPGGNPYNPRFGDRYRSERGGLTQAREVFLHGCGLPAAWAGQPQWCILETGFGLGLNFLLAWQAWKADPLRPQILHFVSVEAFPASREDMLRAAAAHPELGDLAAQLHGQWWGLLPGLHRLVFEDGQLLLTLCIDDAKTLLRQQSFEADSVYLDGFSPDRNPDLWDVHLCKAVARCCRRGTRIATWTVARTVRDALAQCGFSVNKYPGSPPKRDRLEGEFNPAWEPKKARSLPPRPPKPVAARCVVIGAGLAGAAAAASLSRRGWQVTVLDAASAPAQGASGLPAGVLAPHVSPDDSLLSKLSRAGVRATLQQATALLKTAADWNPAGVLERSLEQTRQLPATWQQHDMEAANDWVGAAGAEKLVACGLPADDTALWHARGGWIRPASLVSAWLAAPGITWRGQSAVSRLVWRADAWQVLDEAGDELARAELVIVAAGFGSRALALSANPAAAPPALQAIRGQVTWSALTPADARGLPPFPVNGHGSLITGVPLPGGGPDQQAWLAGSTYERGSTDTGLRAEDDQYNVDRMKILLPQTAAQLTRSASMHRTHAWTGVRCATPGRLPAVGPLPAPDGLKRLDGPASVWLFSGLGSRGLTFAALCAELLAARLHGEPLPVTQKLADALLPVFETA